jgi:hypothetical protein
MGGIIEAFKNLPGVVHLVGQLALVSVGVAIALKGGKWWGWLVVAAAFYWAWVIWMPYVR